MLWVDVSFDIFGLVFVSLNICYIFQDLSGFSYSLALTVVQAAGSGALAKALDELFFWELTGRETAL